jgi:hypothetical protein
MINNNEQSVTKRPISDRQPRQQFGAFSTHQTSSCHAILDDQKQFVADMKPPAPNPKTPKRGAGA